MYDIYASFNSVAELHYFYEAPGKNFDVAAASVPTKLYSKPKCLKQK
jgi:hypothetical protein